MAENVFEKVEDEIKSEPWYVWAGAAAAAGLVVYFIWKQRSTPTSSSVSSSSANSADASNGTSEGAVSPFGDLSSGYNYLSGPVGNFPGGSYSEVGVNGNNVPIVPFGDTPIFDSNGNLIGWQQPNPNPTPTTTPPPTTNPPPTPNPPPPTTNPPPTPNPPPPQQEIYVVQHGDNLSEIVQKLGLHGGWQALYNQNRAVIGDNPNLIFAGERLNYTGLGNGGMGGGGFHLAINKGRNTMDQWTFANGMHQDFDSYAQTGE